MTDIEYSDRLQAREDHVFVGDFRAVADRAAMRSQLVTWSDGRWFVASTSYVDIDDFKADQTPESAYRSALDVALSTLKDTLVAGGISTHPVLGLERLPDAALELAMDERQLAFVYHVLGWGHVRTDRCRFCSRFEESGE